MGNNSSLLGRRLVGREGREGREGKGGTIPASTCLARRERRPRHPCLLPSLRCELSAREHKCTNTVYKVHRLCLQSVQTMLIKCTDSDVVLRALQYYYGVVSHGSRHLPTGWISLLHPATKTTPRTSNREINFLIDISRLHMLRWDCMSHSDCTCLIQTVHVSFFRVYMSHSDCTCVIQTVHVSIRLYMSHSDCT